MKNNIAYQNKDIVSKLFAERCLGKSIEAYGLRLPPVKSVLPTNIPVIQAKELRIDNVFLLTDNTIAIIDYESDYKKKHKHKYIRYINHIAEYYSQKWKRPVHIRMIVIYTGDIEPEKASNILDMGSLYLTTESVYLSRVDSQAVLTRLETKIKHRIPLTEQELMEFVILPLTYKGREEKNNSIRKAINLAKYISDEETKVFLLSGMAVFADKVTKSEYADEIRRLISMTKVGQLFEQEKLDFAAQKQFEILYDMVLDGIISEDEAAKRLNYTIDKFEKMKETILAKA